MNLQAVLLLSGALFSAGIFGLLTRRNAIGILLAVELMANAVNINFVAFAFARGDHTGQVFALFSIALTVAEVAVGLALVILLFRQRRNVMVEEAAELEG